MVSCLLVLHYEYGDDNSVQAYRDPYNLYSFFKMSFSIILI